MVRIMVALLVGVFFWLSSRPLRAQAAGNAWQPGYYWLTDGQERPALLRYNATNDLLQVRTAVGINVLSARQVRGFTLLDTVGNKRQQFEALAYNPRADYPRQAFFEVVLRGACRVVRRPAEPEASAPRPAFLPDFLYYVHQPGQATPLVAFRHFRRTILPRMRQEFGSELEWLMRSKGLSMSGLANKIRLVNQYNHLLATQRPAVAQADQ